MDCSSATEFCCILVHTAQASAETKLSTLLTAWLHWYGRLDLETAIQVSPPTCSLVTGLPRLTCCAKFFDLFLVSGVTWQP